ncbi:pH-response transcription factor pacC/RIM101 [Smittium mucronatum]|uniref:pH-response transcription factor pacC/RIM101 n=1 Tax=Smittium mucronatum TaxID=133383 RepID=A0A1R0GW05_9FUNG|nr:pH-response transcription factor pacC/RIM101 [Smittium mucronatum]
MLPCKWKDCTEGPFPNDEDLYTHLTNAHVGWKSTGNLNLECHWLNCSVKTTKRDHITSHLRVHVNLKQFKCSQCNKSFKWVHDLKKHSKIHSPDNPDPNTHSQTSIPSLENNSTLLPKSTLKRGFANDPVSAPSFVQPLSATQSSLPPYHDQNISFSQKIDSISDSMKRFCTKDFRENDKDEFLDSLNQLLMTDPNQITKLPDSLALQENLFYLNQGFLKLFPDLKEPVSSPPNFFSDSIFSSSPSPTPTLSDDSLLFDNLISQINGSDPLGDNFLINNNTTPLFNNDVSYSSLLPTTPSNIDYYSSSKDDSSYPQLLPDMNSLNVIPVHNSSSNNTSQTLLPPSEYQSLYSSLQYRDINDSSLPSLTASIPSPFNLDIASSTLLDSDVPSTNSSGYPSVSPDLLFSQSLYNPSLPADNLSKPSSTLLSSGSIYDTNSLNQTQPNNVSFNASNPIKSFQNNLLHTDPYSYQIQPNNSVPAHSPNNITDISPQLSIGDHHYTVDSLMNSSSPSLPSSNNKSLLYNQFLNAASSIGINLTPNQIKRLQELQVADSKVRNNLDTNNVYSQTSVPVPKINIIGESPATLLNNTKMSGLPQAQPVYHNTLSNSQIVPNNSLAFNPSFNLQPNAQYVSRPLAIRHNNFQQSIQNHPQNTFSFKNMGIQQKSFNSLQVLTQQNTDSIPSPQISPSSSYNDDHQVDSEFDFSKPVNESMSAIDGYSGLLGIVDSFKSLEISNDLTPLPTKSSSSVPESSPDSHQPNNLKDTSLDSNTDVKSVQSSKYTKVDPKAAYALLARINALYLLSR